MLTKPQRELIVRLKQDGKKQDQIASLIGCSQAAVSKWISKFERGRTLDTLPRSGRPTPLQGAIKEKIKAKLLHEVKDANEKFCSISTKQLAKIINTEINQNYTLRHVERILHNMGFSLTKPRPQHIKHDAQKVADFREEFKKNSNKNTWVVS
jgi:transposase